MVEAKRYGLEVHEDKTKILWNGMGRGTSADKLEIGGRSFEVIRDEASTMYLGRLLSFQNVHDTELKHRFAKGWAKFAIYRNELTNNCYSLRQRMRLFASVVQPSVLYGCVSWSMTKQREHSFRTVQRKMVRKIVGTRPARVTDEQGDVSLEDHVLWMKRATRKAEEALEKHGVPCWVEESYRRKYRWAGHVARRDDERWSRQVLCWNPVGVRAQGRPLTRWSDALNKFFDSVSAALGQCIDWMSLTKDRDEWKQFETPFVEFCTG